MKWLCALPFLFFTAAAGPILWDNGPLVTHPGGGFGGADASTLQNESLWMNLLGAGFQHQRGNRLADDFTVSAGSGWDVGGVTLLGYQSLSGETSPFTGAYLQIWDGLPDAPGSSVVWGDLTTNVLLSATFSGIYRVNEHALLSPDRPIFALSLDVDTHLDPGAYWLAFAATGSEEYSGPWAPPITILGQSATGNAMQFVPESGWDDLIDYGLVGSSPAPQGLPFIIEGRGGAAAIPEPGTLGLMGAALVALAFAIRRR